MVLKVAVSAVRLGVAAVAQRQIAPADVRAVLAQSARELKAAADGDKPFPRGAARLGHDQ